MNSYELKGHEIALTRKALVEAIDSIQSTLECNLPPRKRNWNETDRSNFSVWSGRLKAYKALLKAMGGRKRGDSPMWKLVVSEDQ